MLIKFRLAWILSTLTLFGTKSAFAYLCMCSLDSCTVIHPDNTFFDKADSVCSSDMSKANEISFIKLQQDKLSPKAFKIFPSMTILEILQGKLTDLNEGTFSSAGKLSKLLIQGNNLTSLKDHSFQGAENLKDLTISDNPLVNVTENAFSNLRNLENLVLTGGKIKLLPKNVFKNNRNLRKISLNSNQLSAIDSDMFKDLYQLIKLELSDNRLKTFDVKVLKAKLVVLNNNQLEKVVVNLKCRSMYANNNSISTIEAITLNLKKLSVMDNKLHDISNITRVKSLTSLSLSGNKVNPRSKFSMLTSLEELDLRSTNIDLTKDTFIGLRQLQTLDLSYNNLTKVDFKIFNDQKSLQTLKFVGNRIKAFDYQKVQRYLPQLRVMEICKNGWNTSYLEVNVNSLENLGINGFGSDYTNKCAEKVTDDYVYDDSAEQMDDEIEEFSSNKSISPRSMGTTPPTVIPESTDENDSDVNSSMMCITWWSSPLQCFYHFCRTRVWSSLFFC